MISLDFVVIVLAKPPGFRFSLTSFPFARTGGEYRRKGGHWGSVWRMRWAIFEEPWLTLVCLLRCLLKKVTLISIQ